MKVFGKLTAVELWTDPYISKQMLKHHLSYKDDIASRKYDTIKTTVDFISNNYMKSKKSVLDLGCGPGLYTNLFSMLGYAVKGIDISSNSIDYARTHNSKVEYEQLNYVDMKPRGMFDLITMIYCDFSVLDYNQRNRLLSNVKSMLNPDGHFVFDVHSMNLYDNFKQGDFNGKERDGFYMTGECDITISNNLYSKEKVCLTHIHAKGIRDLEFFNWYQCYSKNTINKLLNTAGFQVVDIYSDTIGNKKYKESDSLCVVAKVI